MDLLVKGTDLGEDVLQLLLKGLVLVLIQPSLGTRGEVC